jgi:hypothetical protein
MSEGKRDTGTAPALGKRVTLIVRPARAVQASTLILVWLPSTMSSLIVLKDSPFV